MRAQEILKILEALILCLPACPPSLGIHKIPKLALDTRVAEFFGLISCRNDFL